MHLILSSFRSKMFEHCQFLKDLVLISFIYTRTKIRAGNGTHMGGEKRMHALARKHEGIGSVERPRRRWGRYCTESY